MRRSAATWSLRLRPVCSIPATGPASSKSRRSTAVWMSSSLDETTKASLDSSAAIARSPASTARCSALLSTPMLRSMRAWARDPATSSAPSRRSTARLDGDGSTRGGGAAARSGGATPPRSPLDVQWSGVLERALHARLGTERQAEQLDEPARRGVVEAVSGAIICGEIAAIQRTFGATSDDSRRAAVEAHPHRAGHVDLRLLDEPVQGAAERREPQSVVHQTGTLVSDDALEASDIARHRETLERLVRRMQGHRCGRLVDLARFDADEPVLDMVDTTDPERPRGCVQLGNQLITVQPASIERNRDTALETDLHDRGRGKRLRVRRPLEDFVGRLAPRVLEHATLDAPAPEICVDRVRGLLGRHDLDAMGGCIFQLLRPAHVPVSHRCNHPQLGGERADGDIE